jgi:hypothetical protein
VVREDKELPSLNIIFISSVLCIMNKVIVRKIIWAVNNVAVFWDVTSNNLLSGH